jgi:hypothetical protein
MKFRLVIVTDCGGSDRGRYEIAAQRCFAPQDVDITFFATRSMNTLHTGFTTAAHGLSTIDHFGPLKEEERFGILSNAAPRLSTNHGPQLRGQARDKAGEEIYALLLNNGVWVVGPNASLNFYFLRKRIVEAYLVIDRSGMSTPFRSMEVMVPALAKVLGANDHENIDLVPQWPSIPDPIPGTFVADWDDHGNLYIVSIGGSDWLPGLGEGIAIRIGERVARVRHVDGIFAGQTGELTITKGSLKLNGLPVHYLVVVGSSAKKLFGNPDVGAELIIES